MNAATYADLSFDFAGPRTGDEISLHLIKAEEATSWFETLDDFQKSAHQAQAQSLQVGATGALLGPDGTIESAYLIYDEGLIWQAASAATTLPKGRYRIDEARLNEAERHALALGFALGQYQSNLLGTERTIPELASCHLESDDRRAMALARGTYLCRDLINSPANQMTPAALAQEAQAVAKQFGATCEVTTGEALAAEYPAIHTVGRAAETPPCLIDMKWGTKGPKITLVGKGVTFDSGGLDLKPSKAMEMMKKDMGGSAHVLGLAVAIMMMDMPVQLRVLIGAAENAVSDKAMRPMDVIDTRAGIKVEVGNTDAEGRLVLADALCLALEDEPDFLVDFATLTGAARVALGTSCPALFCNSDSTARMIMDAGKQEHDPIWQLPLFEPYDAQLDTGHMALSSTGPSGYGGAITAALFLRRFTGKDVNWAHIDVMAWNLASQPGRPKGGEAMGLRAIFRTIEDMT